jgi:protease-4
MRLPLPFDPVAATSRVGRGVQELRSRLPGARPEWVVLALRGSFPERSERPRLFGVPLPLAMAPAEASLEHLRELVAGLASASFVRGVLLDLSGLTVGATTAHALREALSALPRAGKRLVAWVPHLDWLTYYVATAAPEIAAPECAELRLVGLGASQTYFGELLGRLGVRFEKVARGRYKAAFDELARERMSEPTREQLEALLGSLEGHFVETVAKARGLEPAALRRALEDGVVSAEEAKHRGLVDRLAYLDELAGPKHKSLGEAARFLAPARREPEGGRVAVVELCGAIVPGRSRRSPAPLPVPGGQLAGAESVARALRLARDDERTKAVVLHVDSPGGSAMASDLLWHVISRLDEKKPVVACFGAVAASGGYYVAAGARKIVAAPTTVTGSIGVLSGKLSLDGLFARHGVHVEEVGRGRLAHLGSAGRPWDEAERAFMERGADDAYERFVARVAKGRGLSRERVLELAEGRIWSGLDAAARGLVDELGSLERALAVARELAGLSPDAPHWNVGARTELVLPGAEAAAVTRAFAALSAGPLALASAPRFVGATQTGLEGLSSVGELTGRALEAAKTRQERHDG